MKQLPAGETSKSSHTYCLLAAVVLAVVIGAIVQPAVAQTSVAAASHSAWAAVDQNSEFAVVPEASEMLLAASGILMVVVGCSVPVVRFWWHKRR